MYVYIYPSHFNCVGTISICVRQSHCFLIVFKINKLSLPCVKAKDTQRYRWSAHQSSCKTCFSSSATITPPQHVSLHLETRTTLRLLLQLFRWLFCHLYRYPSSPAPSTYTLHVVTMDIYLRIFGYSSVWGILCVCIFLVLSNCISSLHLWISWCLKTQRSTLFTLWYAMFSNRCLDSARTIKLRPLYRSADVFASSFL